MSGNPARHFLMRNETRLRKLEAKLLAEQAADSP